MLYAKVVFGFPVEGPFDYIVPANLARRLKPGSRVWVNFRTKRALGYVVKITQETKIKNLKPILDMLDDTPLLDKNILLLTKELASHYCCSWGEAIETALPEPLKKGRALPSETSQEPQPSTRASVQGISTKRRAERDTLASRRPPREGLLIHDLDGFRRWDTYIKKIKQVLDNHKSVILVSPDMHLLKEAEVIINNKLGVKPKILSSRRPLRQEDWIKIRQARADIVLGTRSAIFAPLKHLGLIIVDEEQDAAYKQEQTPHYHLREVARMRADIEGAELILGSSCPSLESFYLARENKINYMFIPRESNYPEVKIIDMRYVPEIRQKKKAIFSKYLTDSISSVLNSAGKILLFLNRRGFATLCSCRACGRALTCPRCNVGLVYHFKEKILNCHYCNFKMDLPNICPTCNSGYIKFSGVGSELVESELSRLFAQANIARFDARQWQPADFKKTEILVATSSIIKQAMCKFDLVGVLSIDNSLNRIDLRSAEKTFSILSGLLRLTDKKIIIQTKIPKHYCFQALASSDTRLFYDKELEYRRQAHFPPYRHMVLVKLRGRCEEKVEKISAVLFDKLNNSPRKSGIKIMSVNPASPAKLRGKFYWQILAVANNPKKASRFLKINLKDFSRSGIIVTVDIDP